MIEESKLALERLNKRIHVALPIRITYWDQQNKPCLEMACTYDISARGARVSGLRCMNQPGEIVAVQRGLNKAFCRVVWVGEENSELQGQVGIECVENARTMWENELREMEEIYEPVQRDAGLYRLNSSGGNHHGNRRRHARLPAVGIAELINNENRPEATLKNLSELGCLLETQQRLIPGTEVKLVLNVSNYDLSVKAEVRHSAGKLGAGIEFREIRKGDRQVLQYLLRKLEEQQSEESAAQTVQARAATSSE